MSAVRAPARSARTLTAGLALAVFAARALITPGFMPADGRPLALELCPEGLPAQLLPPAHHQHHHQHDGKHPRSEHCVFAGACPGGPVSNGPQLAGAVLTGLVATLPCVAPAAPIRLVHLPQVRAPPAAV